MAGRRARGMTMIYALCFASNTVHCFRDEGSAADYCRCHAGDWQLCDEQGRPRYPAGFAPRLRAELLAAHLWLAAAHDEAAMPWWPLDAHPGPNWG